MFEKYPLAAGLLRPRRSNNLFSFHAQTGTSHLKKNHLSVGRGQEKAEKKVEGERERRADEHLDAACARHEVVNRVL